MTADQQLTSPGAADPRVEAVVDALIEHGHNGIDCYHAMSLDDTVEDVILAADAADRAAGIVRVDTRDEATIERAGNAIVGCPPHSSADVLARAVLAAVRGEH